MIKGSIIPSYGIVENETALNEFDVIRDPYHPDYIGYSYSENDQREIDHRNGTLHGRPGVVPTTTAPQTPSKPLREEDLHTGNPHEEQKDLSEEFRRATIPMPKTYTQEQVDQMLKLASAGAKVTVEKEGEKEEKPEKEEEKSSRTSRAIPYVAPPSISSDVMKVEVGKAIVSPSLEDKHIKLWGTKVQGFETSYGRYDRNRISVEVRERINFRWISNLYIDSLPERLRASREEGKENNNWTWLNHDVISSEELTSFLLATVNSGTGHDVGDQKHELVNQWIKTQTLSFTTGELQTSWEDFILGWEKTITLHTPNVQELTPAHQKGIIEELKSMVNRSASRKDTIPHLAMAFLLPFQNKVLRQVDVLIKDLSEAFNGVI